MRELGVRRYKDEYSIRKYTKDEMYEALLAESNDTTFLFRIFGFVLIWFAFCNAMHDVAAPFSMVAEFLPMVGPYVGTFGLNINPCTSECLVRAPDAEFVHLTPSSRT